MKKIIFLILIALLAPSANAWTDTSNLRANIEKKVNEILAKYRKEQQKQQEQQQQEQQRRAQTEAKTREEIAQNEQVANELWNNYRPEDYITEPTQNQDVAEFTHETQNQQQNARVSVLENKGVQNDKQMLAQENPNEGSHGHGDWWEHAMKITEEWKIKSWKRHCELFGYMDERCIGNSRKLPTKKKSQQGGQTYAVGRKGAKRSNGQVPKNGLKKNGNAMGSSQPQNRQSIPAQVPVNNDNSLLPDKQKNTAGGSKMPSNTQAPSRYKYNGSATDLSHPRHRQAIPTRVDPAPPSQVEKMLPFLSNHQGSTSQARNASKPRFTNQEQYQQSNRGQNSRTAANNSGRTQITGKQQGKNIVAGNPPMRDIYGNEGRAPEERGGAVPQRRRPTDERKPVRSPMQPGETPQRRRPTGSNEPVSSPMRPGKPKTKYPMPIIDSNGAKNPEILYNADMRVELNLRKMWMNDGFVDKNGRFKSAEAIKKEIYKGVK